MRLFSLSTVLLLTTLVGAQDSFDALLARTLREHPRVLDAEAMVRGERAMRNESLTAYRPMVSANGTFANGIGSMVFPSTVAPLNFAVLPRDRVVLGNLTLMWNVWSGGRDALTSSAGKARVEAVEHMLNAVRLDVALNLWLASYDYLLAVGVVEARKTALASAEQTEQTARLREEAGEVPMVYVLRAASVTMKARSELAMAEAALATAKARLDEAAGFAIDVTGIVRSIDAQVPASFEEANALSNQRDEIKYFELMARAKGLDNKIADRSLLPEVSLMAMGDTMRSSDNLTETTSKVGVVVSIPLIDGGMRRAKASAADAEERKYKAQGEQMRLAITREVASAWAEWGASQKVIESAKAGLAFAEESLTVERLRFENGESIMAELLESQAMKEEADVAMLEAIKYAYSAKAMLLRAIGSTSLLNKQTN